MSGTMLKIVAMVSMFISHFYTFYENVPLFFLMIGRIAAPLFIFCAVAIGLEYTKSVGSYMWRLYLLTLIMEWINVMIYAGDYYHNFVRTILLIIMTVTLIENINAKKKNAKRNAVLFLLWQVVTFILLVILIIRFHKPDTILRLFATITCSVFLLEGGMIYIILGVLMYFYRDNYKKLGVTLLIISAAMFVIFSTNAAPVFSTFCDQRGLGAFGENVLAVIDNIFGMDPRFVERGVFIHPQWMMFFAFPFMLLYDSEKRSRVNLKWLGYIFYPTHLTIMYLIRLAIIKAQLYSSAVN